MSNSIKNDLQKIDLGSIYEPINKWIVGKMSGIYVFYLENFPFLAFVIFVSFRLELRYRLEC